jgi:hypothetical protein
MQTRRASGYSSSTPRRACRASLPIGHLKCRRTSSRPLCGAIEFRRYRSSPSRSCNARRANWLKLQPQQQHQSRAATPRRSRRPANMRPTSGGRRPSTAMQKRDARQRLNQLQKQVPALQRRRSASVRRSRAPAPAQVPGHAPARACLRPPPKKVAAQEVAQRQVGGPHALLEALAN